jgi:two-component system chemotaxis sensor kinase CheA
LSKDENNFLKKLLATFKIEADEHINNISSGLINLERETSDEKQMEIIETIFREVHSLKGAARTVNVESIEDICQSFEDVFAKLKYKEIVIKSDFFDILHQTVDILRKLILFADSETDTIDKSKITKIVHVLDSFIEGAPIFSNIEDLEEIKAGSSIILKDVKNRSFSEEKASSSDTLRISASDLETLFIQIGDMLSVKLSSYQRVLDLQEINIMPEQRKNKWSMFEKEIQKIWHPLTREQKSEKNGTKLQSQKYLEFIDWNRNYLESFENRLIAFEKLIEHDNHILSGMVDNLLNNMKKVLLQPLSSFLEVFPKFVRDLQHDKGKNMELVIYGGAIEIDKRILDEMKDPILHLIRNCVDHGIEKPEERVKKGKPEKGMISINISQKNSNEVEILISDDGAGIDIEKVKASAIKLGIISKTESENLSEKESISLIFHSGISTSPIITDISGRGLGLAIVQEKVENLAGRLSVETFPGVGTTFKLILPITLATFRGIIVRCHDSLFVIPLINVDRVLRIDREEIKTVENKETIELDGQAVSLVRLEDAIELPRLTPNNSMSVVPVVVISLSQIRIAFQVDEILNEQEVLVKNYGKQLSRVRYFSGATILGNGKVLPILNIFDLFKSSVNVKNIIGQSISKPKDEITRRKTVLVVEDSITSRTLLKNILLGAGYNVLTAVDGIDGYTVLQINECDIIVSDVDMPRMDGFNLTAKIRSDKKYAALPVILVTALESDEHKARGIEVGADAYIIKRSFDQSNLLEVIRRLI